MPSDPKDVISRTQKKKSAQALQKLGQRLSALSDVQLEAMELPQVLHTAILELRTMNKHEARRRQMQYIGKVMRHVDAHQLEAALDALALRDYEQARFFKQIEAWRDELVCGDDDCLERLVAQHPAIDRRNLAQLVRNARKASGCEHCPNARRKLFRYLRETLADLSI